MTEAEWQRQVLALAERHGWRSMHVRRSQARAGRWSTTTSVAGWPDLLLWRPGRVVAAELKAENGALSLAQRAVLDELAEAGLEVHVWKPSDLDEVLAVLTAEVAA
ncbi:MAG TPA: VRR-NUC domain-containing protein [Nocardioides sp.]|uniref:VRR-NUC domain-containing protein n=1 Tax=Nocardioides sp. TaxID=35761 RepID=UPI002ED7FDB3